MRKLLHNCDIITKSDDKIIIVKQGWLGIDEAVIDYVGAEKPSAAYDEEKDMDGAVLMPAFVNAHGHASMTLLRGAGNGLPLQRWLEEAIFPVEAKLTPADIAIGTQAAMLEMLACGTASFSEMYDFPFADADAVAKAGMKTNICRTGLCFGDVFDPQSDQRFRESVEVVRVLKGEQAANDECLREIGGMNDDLAEAVRDGRIIPELSLHSEYLTKEPYVRAVAEAAKELQCPVNVHVSETRKEHEECIIRHGKTPIAYLADCGILDSPTYAAHCVWVTDDDLAIMKEKGTSLVHNPSSNLKLGSGIAPVVKALRAGVCVALGTDGCASNNNLNMMEEMHLAALLATGSEHDPAAIAPVDVLRMATEAGAHALCRTRTGALLPGMRADITAVSKDAPHMHPADDLIGLLVYSAQASDVVMTMADGRILYEKGEYLTLDKERILFELEKTVDNIKNRV